MQVPADGDVHAGGGGLRELVADVPRLACRREERSPGGKKNIVFQQVYL